MNGRFRSLLCAGTTAALLAGAPAPAQAQAAPQARSSTAELLQPHLVDIGGRRLNLVCVGEGSPTIVFDLPIFGNLLQWRKVIRPVAEISRA